jgi:superfamily II DNA/RNA helicase
MGDQLKALSDGVDVLIATPGRLMDLFDRGKILLTGCNLLVIDEADRMLDMGFIPDIETICTKLPANRQTLLFSATMPGPIKKLADRFLSNPKYIEVARPASANENIAQFKVPVQSRTKRDTLRELLRREEVTTAIVFCNRKTTVRELAKNLKSHGFAVGEIHGDMDQSSRNAELQRFKDRTINILVASDVAARGLDIKEVSHVFNFDTPWHPDDYVHRIGRTGRAGKTGTAISLVTSADQESIDNIQKLTGTVIRPVAAGAAPEPEPDESAEAHAEAEAERKPRRSRSADKAEKGPRRRSAPAADEAPEPAPKRQRAIRERSEPRPQRAVGGESDAKAPRTLREETDARPPRHAERQRPEPADEDGWNGPVPSFLEFGFGD